MIDRPKVPVAAKWGEAVGYSRAIRAGDLVFVAGTTASGADGAALHPDDAGAQAAVILERIVDALRALGAGPEHVVATTIYTTDIGQWEAIGRAHATVFGQVRPAATMVEVSRLIAPGLLVEISAVASLEGDKEGSSFSEEKEAKRL